MGSAAFPHLFMDPLQKLWELYDDSLVQDKPELNSVESDTMVGSPNEDTFDHPVIKMRNAVDQQRLANVPTENAHERVYGQVDLADVEQKSGMAATMGRVQNDGKRASVKLEKDAAVPSVLSVDDEFEKSIEQSTVDTYKTPVRQEQPGSESPALTQQEEIDYNEDVMYLQKYGRA